MKTAKLAELLLRRKELNDKVAQLKAINQRDLFEVRVKRQNVTDSVDDIVAQVPKISINDVTAAYDFYSRNLRLVDAAIQQANWTTEVEVADSVMNDFESKQ